MAQYDLAALGGNGDDSFDNTAVLQNILNAIYTAGGGGDIIIDGANGVGVFRMSGSVGKNFYGVGGKLNWIFKNSGAIRFVNTGYKRIELANLSVVNFDDATLVGNPDGTFDAQCHVFLTDVIEIGLNRLKLWGLGSPSTEFGCFHCNGGVVTGQEIDMSGSLSVNFGILTLTNSGGFDVRSVSGLDYVTHHGIYLSKTTNQTNTWIYAKDFPFSDARKRGRFHINGGSFDEGCKNSVIVDNVPFVDLNGVACNINVGQGVVLKNVKSAKISQSWFGYGDKPEGRYAVRLDSVRQTELDSVQFAHDVKYIETAGTAGQVIITNTDLPGNTAYPKGINNLANSRIFKDFPLGVMDI